ncbi:LOW QUALITY PROTEIN: ataxin-1-like [Megalops cyprinoides]|uniref:LOW QUALITY PROTEIN: ataxin-1-like n=1 Tax=Megalops cyprinoides TaxID=118141 RepID=UPI00186412A4|nr:LOW QUALITY PROTEIN: ataxin-1-like [Megalops cyprinoides]
MESETACPLPSRTTMKPTHERNQECLPPKKRDLPVSSSSSGAGGGGGAGAGGSGGDKGTSSHGSGSTGGEIQGGGNASGEWMRIQPGLQYSVENTDGVGLPVDQYSMLYKVALPSITYSPTSLHPVLSHISPAYTVPSPLFPYSPLGYAQIPHSSLQFVSSPYAVPYAVPPGFVPSSLIPPQSAVPQPHHVSHLIPYPSVLQEGVVSSPSQPSTSAHTFTKVATAGSVPLVLSPEQAAQQHVGIVGGLPASEVSPRGVPVFYHLGSREAPAALSYRDSHNAQQEQDKEVNGEEEQQGERELLQDSDYSSRGTRPPHVVPNSTTGDHLQDRSPAAQRHEERGSPAHRSTPDTDLEVQQVVGHLTSVQGQTGSHKEACVGPLNLSQSSQRSWVTSSAASGEDVSGHDQTVYDDALTAETAVPRATSHQQQQLGQPVHHAVILANGQPVLIPMDYSQQQHYTGQSNDVVTAAIATTVTLSTASDPPAKTCLPERAAVDLAAQEQQSQLTPVPGMVTTPAPPSIASNPSHFMKGAIIQLATGELKRVEDLQTQDFVKSAEVSGGLKIDSSMVVEVHESQQRPGLVALHFTVGEQQSKVTIDVPPEHPFFVFGQGWSSCSPDRTAQLYGLPCHLLQVGDVCVSITLQQQQQNQQQQQQPVPSRTPTKTSTATSVPSQPVGPPGPQYLRSQPHCRVERTHQEREQVVEEEEPMQVRGRNLGDTFSKPDRTSAERTRTLSGHYLHTEGTPCSGEGVRGVSSLISATQRHWSVPGLQRHGTKDEEVVSVISSSSSRPFFIPQEVKVSIEGRSNAGK